MVYYPTKENPSQLVPHIKSSLVLATSRLIKNLQYYQLLRIVLLGLKRKKANATSLPLRRKSKEVCSRA